MAAFAAALKNLRLEKDLSQQKLADMLGVSKSSISMYEREERQPDFEILETIADFFQVDMNYLLGKYDTGAAPQKISTIAAHKEDGENWTDDELHKIEEYKNLLLAARNSK